MSYCNPFLQLNFASTFALGNYLGNCLRQTLFGDLWGGFTGNPCQNMTFTNPFYADSPICNNMSIFAGGINYTPQFTMSSGFDTFSYSGSMDWSSGGGWGGYGNYSGFIFTSPMTNNFTSPNTKTVDTSGINNGKVANLAWWKEQGYNEEMGRLLAANTKKRSNALHSAGIKGECGKGVRQGINDTFYGGNAHYTCFGQAKNTGRDYLSNDSHFKKVDVSGMHLTKADIPAGAIVIYDAGYSSGELSHCGHIEVSDGNGHGYSDLTTTLLSNFGKRKEPKEIWIPV